MPSAFENIFADRAPAFYASHGVGASYADSAGAVTSGLTLQIDRNDPIQVDSTLKKSGQVQTAEITISAALLAKPMKGGRFTLEGGVEVWTIETTPVLENGQHYCSCSRTGSESLLSRRAKDV